MIRVLIAEDMHLIRGALVALLRLSATLKSSPSSIAGTRSSPTALKTKPDVAVVDIDLPGLDGLSAAEQLREQLPSCRTLVLTGLSQPGNLLRALKVHVRGFLLKDAPAPELANAIRAVASGRRVLDPELVAAAVETGTTPMTEREADVLRAAQSGLSTVEIGERLNLSPATVRNYLSTTIGKLGARNRLDAIRIAEDAGWL